MDDAAASRFGPYELMDRIGRGGMGETWQARRAGLADAPVVVIKRMLPDLADDAELVEAFVNEAHVTATLKHPNIAEVLDFGQVGGEYYFALEHVHGCTVEALLHAAAARGLPRLPVPVACFIAAEVLAGLHHAHTSLGPNGRPLKLVHRDISPDNVLLGFDGRVKIIDFGVAKATMPHRAQTAVGLVKGKVHYFSPEQARALPLDGRSDVFALGVMLYRLVCGALPFKGEGVAATFAMLQGDFIPPHVANPALPTPLVEVLNRALEIKLERRFQTADNMQTALRSLLEHTAPRFSGRTLQAFVHWAFEDHLDSEGVKPAISAADRAQFERWVQREGAPDSGAAFTPLDPRTRNATALARPTGVETAHAPARWPYLAAGAGMFLAGMAGAVVLSLPGAEATAVAAAPVAPRPVAFARAEAAYRALEALSPSAANAQSDELVLLTQQRGGGALGDADYARACLDFEARLEQLTDTARQLAQEAEARQRALADAGIAVPDAGAPSFERAAFFDRQRVELSTPRRVTLRFARHNLLLTKFEVTGQNTWRSRYDDTVRFKVNNLLETSIFGVVTTEPDGKVTLTPYALPRTESVDHARGMRFVDFSPFTFHDPNSEPATGRLFERFSNGRALEVVRFSRANGRFLEVIPLTRRRWVKFARASFAPDETFGVVINCGPKTEVLRNRPVWVERPEACGLALVAEDTTEGTVEIAVSAHDKR
jgi:serine/threonine protein kinase